MLKLSSPEKFRESIAQEREIHSFIAYVLSVAARDSGTVQSIHRGSLQEDVSAPPRGWMTFERDEGGSLSISCPDVISTSSRDRGGERLLRAIGSLSNDIVRSRFGRVRLTSVSEGIQEETLPTRRFFVSGQGNSVSAVWFYHRGFADKLPGSESDLTTFGHVDSRVACQRVLLSARFDPHELKSGYSEAPKVLLSFLGAHGSQKFSGSFYAASNTGKLNLLISEEHMEDKPQVPGVTISLGAIELSLKDLLHLRPGMQIEFDRPQEFFATIQVSGGDWASGMIRFEENRVIFNVTGLNQETFT